MDNLLPDIRYDEAMSRLGGNKKLYLSLLKKFNAREMTDRIIDCIGSGKSDEAAAAAHALKGAAANLALPLLAESAHILERALKSGLPVSEEREALELAAAAAAAKIAALLESDESRNG